MKKGLKKIGQVILCILPLLCALLIQVVIAGIGMVVYGLVKGFELAAKGVTDTEGMTKAIADSLRSSETLLAVSAFAAIISIVIFSLWFRRTAKKNGTRNILKIFSFKSIWHLVLLGVGLQVGIAILLNTIATIKPEWFESYGELMEQLGMGNSVLSVLLIVLLAPISEELIFRGVILYKSKKVMSLAAANLLQAILFGIYHLNLIQGIYAFAVGLFLGMVCIKFKSLWASILLHMIINLGGILLNMVLTDKLLQLPVAMVGILFLSIVAIAYSSIKISKKQNSEEVNELVIG